MYVTNIDIISNTYIIQFPTYLSDSNVKYNIIAWF